MAYDEQLAARVRDALAGQAAVSERAMFGGLAFLLHGNMTVGVSGRGGLMVRVGPNAYADALGEPHARRLEMSGRPMTGWVVVEEEGVASDAALAAWVRRGVGFAASLPPKGAR